jgi:hypothetical protein
MSVLAAFSAYVTFKRRSGAWQLESRSCKREKKIAFPVWFYPVSNHEQLGKKYRPSSLRK